MSSILLQYDAFYAEKERDNKEIEEKIYDTLKFLHDTIDKKATFTDLKMNNVDGAIWMLEKQGYINQDIDYKTIIENSQRQRIKSYSLTPKGEDLIDDIIEHMKDHKYTTFAEIKPYFNVSAIIPTAALRDKLYKIEEQHRKNKI